MDGSGHVPAPRSLVGQEFGAPISQQRRKQETQSPFIWAGKRAQTATRWSSDRKSQEGTATTNGSRTVARTIRLRELRRDHAFGGDQRELSSLVFCFPAPASLGPGTKRDTVFHRKSSRRDTVLARQNRGAAVAQPAQLGQRRDRNCPSKRTDSLCLRGASLRAKRKVSLEKRNP